MNVSLESLRQKARLAPEGPGIYIHRDHRREVLYVGKARNLRNRLKSYFYGSDRLNERLRQLVARIADFDIVLTQSESESLVLEAQFIKSHQPPFNVLLRDGKAYPYVRIDPREEWATARMVRRRQEDGALYFGPYPSGAGVFGVLGVVRKFFPLIKCSPRTMKTIPRPCNYFHMRQCLAPCHMPVDPKAYKLHVESVIALLRGQITTVRANLHQHMLAASLAEDFEQAAVYRDQIKAVEGLLQAQSVDLGFAIDADLVSVFWGVDRFAVSIAGMRQGKLVSSNAYSSLYAVDDSDEDGASEETLSLSKHTDLQLRHRSLSLESLLRMYYLNDARGADLVPLVCILDRQGHWTAASSQSFSTYLQGLAQAYFRQEQQPQSVVVGLADCLATIRSQRTKIGARAWKAFTQDLERLSESLYDTARQKYQQDKLVGTQHEHMVLGLQSFLSLKVEPAWVECFDISTFQGSETVASQVVFRDGRPHRKGYRRYIIRSLETQDDFGSLREVMRRRFRDVTLSALPDLLLVDGGEPQLREVRRVLVGMGLQDLAVVGIAKSRTRASFVSDTLDQSCERLVVISGSDAEGMPVSYETKTLRVGSPEYRLVTQLRNEAHRFAITFHRERRSKKSLRGLLDDVPGLGPKRKRQLLLVFPSPLEMLTEEPQVICQRSGVPLAVIEQVLRVLREHKAVQRASSDTPV